jgi:hypothetical protein
MSRPVSKLDQDDEFQPASRIERLLGQKISHWNLKTLALAGAIKFKTHTSVITVYSVSDVKAWLAEEAKVRDRHLPEPMAMVRK